MEARLLCLETTGRRDSSNHWIWFIANGTGLPISQAQTPASPRPLFTADYESRGLIEYLTAKMADPEFAIVEPDWSKWFVRIPINIWSRYSSRLIGSSTISETSSMFIPRKTGGF